MLRPEKGTIHIATFKHEPYLVVTERRTVVHFPDSTDLTHSGE